MKVLMLNPPYFKNYSRQSRSPCVAKGGTIYYPYFLAYATGVLEKNGIYVKLVDAVAKKWSSDETIEFVKQFSPNLVVIDTSTPSIFNDIEIASKIKIAVEGVHVCLVGTHPTALPEETLKISTKIDSICRGEYDYTVLDLAKKIESGGDLRTIDGISFRFGGKIIHNKSRPLIQNLDELPFVSKVYKDHLNINDYFYASLMHPEITILTARGCTYNCTFCNSPFKASYRARSPENVVEEFEFIQEEFPEVKEVMIEDDTFPISKKRTLAICNLMVKKGIKLKWSCNARVNTDFSTLKAMKEGGCRLMCVGFETPVQEVLDNVHKRTNRDIQIEFMRNARKVGILVHGCFILGLPGDTKETISETIEFAKELNSDTIQMYPMMVYPGTEAYEWAKKNNFLITEDYSKWLTSEGLHNTVVSRPNLTSQELVQMCDEGRKEFYLRPSYVFSKVKQMITHPSEGKRILKAGKVFFKFLIRRSVPEEFLVEH